MFLYLVSIMALVHVQCEKIYTNKYDGVDLEEILSSERLLTGYVNCLLDLGPCTPDAMELKKNLPDAIDNNCEMCTEWQREGADQVMQYIIEHRPGDWEKLEQKYNEDGSYKRKYLNSKQKEGNSTETYDKDENKSKENN
uniref:Chemosensory protein 4 n=1 Tax=Apocheima cinerarius TaxID=706528 RepID=A0A8T9EQB7_APOCI|nr:chemosensory protein 4 [Apocheima cinerarius]